MRKHQPLHVAMVGRLSSQHGWVLDEMYFQRLYEDCWRGVEGWSGLVGGPEQTVAHFGGLQCTQLMVDVVRGSMYVWGNYPHRNFDLDEEI
jgi:hypothetical protein